MEKREQNTSANNQEYQTEVVCDLPRSENEVYRISRREYKGIHYVDLRIFFRSREDKDRLLPAPKGICFEEKHLQALNSGLINARKAPAVQRPEGMDFHSVVIAEIPATETEVYRISKGCGSKNGFVDIRKFFKKNEDYVPYKKKGVSIQDSMLDDVITALISLEPLHC